MPSPSPLCGALARSAGRRPGRAREAARGRRALDGGWEAGRPSTPSGRGRPAGGARSQRERSGTSLRFRGRGQPGSRPGEGSAAAESVSPGGSRGRGARAERARSARALGAPARPQDETAGMESSSGFQSPREQARRRRRDLRGVGPPWAAPAEPAVLVLPLRPPTPQSPWGRSPPGAGLSRGRGPFKEGRGLRGAGPRREVARGVRSCGAFKPGLARPERAFAAAASRPPSARRPQSPRAARPPQRREPRPELRRAPAMPRYELALILKVMQRVSDLPPRARLPVRAPCGRRPSPFPRGREEAGARGRGAGGRRVSAARARGPAGSARPRARGRRGCARGRGRVCPSHGPREAGVGRAAGSSGRSAGGHARAPGPAPVLCPPPPAGTVRARKTVSSVWCSPDLGRPPRCTIRLLSPCPATAVPAP